MSLLFLFYYFLKWLTRVWLRKNNVEKVLGYYIINDTALILAHPRKSWLEKRIKCSRDTTEGI